jgi:hypothetical protein
MTHLTDGPTNTGMKRSFKATVLQTPSPPARFKVKQLERLFLQCQVPLYRHEK